MKIREKLYTTGFFRQTSLSVPVISVGNLVLGGTGKTPTVRHLAKLLLLHGYRPAIISRGYGGKAKNKINIVSDGHTVFLSAEEAGDEPNMLAENLPGVPILTGKRRLAPCRLAIEKYNADVLILDDGFQHLAIQRDLDLVLFSGTDPIGTARVFPGGILREPLSALRRCDAFVITGMTADNDTIARQFGAYLEKQYQEKPVFFASLGNIRLQNIDTPNEAASPDDTYFAFCGIANPSRFGDSLRSLSIRQSGFLAFPDHMRYTQAIMTDICRQASISGAKHLVTTQKDFVKIKNFYCSLPRHVIEICLKTESEFDSFIVGRIKEIKGKKLPPFSNVNLNLS